MCSILRCVSRLSFKRRPKASTSSFGFSRYLPSSLGSSSNRTSPQPRSHRPNGSTELILNYLDTPGNAGEHLQDTKDANGLDWYIEGPGRRVGYDDLTAIDWIFEYAKERQRLRYLYTGSSGLLGHIKQLADASQVWIILVAAGILSGGIAAFIDVASDWLADLKTGYCHNVDGDGRFYLNKSFCCWGIEEEQACHDWNSWGAAMGIDSVGGRYVVEYIFFVLFSVLFAACASLLVREFSPYAKHSGIPEIKTVLGGFVIRHFLGGWTLVTKTIGLCFAVASGLWLGKEGPLVHVACCSANLFMKLFGNVNGNEGQACYPAVFPNTLTSEQQGNERCSRPRLQQVSQSLSVRPLVACYSVSNNCRTTFRTKPCGAVSYARWLLLSRYRPVTRSTPGNSSCTKSRTIAGGMTLSCYLSHFSES
ncbi:chloride channel protein 3 [Alternaria alternata]|nr:chloride channel protein 3 [Alternaria alternata]